MGTVLRLIGGAPTEEELRGVVSTFGEEGFVNFQEFLDVVEKHRNSHGFMADELRFSDFLIKVKVQLFRYNDIT